MKLNITLFLLISLCLYEFSSAQDYSKIEDSLQLILKSSGEDTTKVNILNTLSRKFRNKDDYREAFSYANDALVLAEKINFKEGIALAYDNIGSVYAQQNNYELALKNYLDALKISEEIKFKTGIIVTNGYIASLYAQQKDYSHALKYYSENLKIGNENNYKKTLADTYFSIGGVYRVEDNYPVALKNYLASLKVFEEIDDKKGMANTYSVIGFIFESQGNISEALKNCTISLKIAEEINFPEGIVQANSNIALLYSEQGNYPEAIKHQLAVLKVDELIGHKKSLVISYNNLAFYYMKLGKNAEAENYVKKSLLLAEEIGDKGNLATAYGTYGELCMQMQKFSEARSYLSKELVLAKGAGIKYTMRDCYNDLSKLDSITGDFKSSNQYLRLYSKMRDSIMSEESEKMVSQLKIQYESEKKDKKIEMQEAEVKKQKFINYAVISFAMLILLMGVIIFNNIRIKNKAAQLVRANEIRRKISRDLHDEIGAGLTSISMICEQAKMKKLVTDNNKNPAGHLQPVSNSSNHKNEVIELVDSIRIQSRSVSDKLREVVWATNPENDNLDVLLSYIRNYVSKFLETSSITYTLNLSDEAPNINLKPDVRSNIIFVLKEALNNCVKHSEATEIEILFRVYSNRNYLFQITDNGKGVDYSAMPVIHSGINNMRRRTEDINSSFQMVSEEGKGTRITIEGILI